MNIRTQRIASHLQKEISDIVAHEMRDKNINFVTITYLKLAPDLSYARIYFTTLNDEKKEETLDNLNNAKGFIKSELCKRKLKIRKIPEIEFAYDESITYGSNIERIIKKLHE